LILCAFPARFAIASDDLEVVVVCSLKMKASCSITGSRTVVGYSCLNN